MKRRSNIERTDRLNSEFQKEIYDVIKREVKNPFITEMFSVTDVVTSKDLAHANVYISVYSNSEAKKKATFEAIKSESWKIRRILSKTMKIRTVPELHILPDDSMEYGDKMDKLISKANSENSDGEN